MIPQEAANIANELPGTPPIQRTDIHRFLYSESARNIEAFTRLLNPIGKERYLLTAKTALEIKLSENADLIADKLSKQTTRLLRFTIGLYVLTTVLVGFTFVQIVIAILDYCSQNH